MDVSEFYIILILIIWKVYDLYISKLLILVSKIFYIKKLRNNVFM